MNMFLKTRLNSHIRTMLFFTGWSKFCLGSQFTVFVTLCFTLRATFAFDAVCLRKSLFPLLTFCCIRLDFFTSTARWTCICCFLFPFHFQTPFVFFTPFGPAKLSESLSLEPIHSNCNTGWRIEKTDSHSVWFSLRQKLCSQSETYGCPSTSSFYVKNLKSENIRTFLNESIIFSSNYHA